MVILTASNLKKTIAALLGLLIIGSLLSCASNRPYYHPLEPNAPLKGRVALAGCQLKRKAAERTVTFMRTSIRTTMQWENGDPLMLALNEALTPEAKQSLPIATLPDQVFKAYRSLRSNGFLLTKESNAPATGFISLYDQEGKPDQLDPKILKILNDSLDLDYYLLLDGDIIDYVVPSLANFMEFSLEFEISLIAYDRLGKKVLSRHYSRRFERLNGFSWVDSEAYIEVLGMTMESIAEQLNADILAFIPARDTKPDQKLNI